MDTSTTYNVCCIICGTVWTPSPGSLLWWKAWLREQQGYLDAPHVSARECGCSPIPYQAQPKAPYRVFGFQDDGSPFDIPFPTFVRAAKKFRALYRRGTTVFFKDVENRRPQLKEELYRLGC